MSNKYFIWENKRISRCSVCIWHACTASMWIDDEQCRIPYVGKMYIDESTTMQQHNYMINMQGWKETCSFLSANCKTIPMYRSWSMQESAGLLGRSSKCMVYNASFEWSVRWKFREQILTFKWITMELHLHYVFNNDKQSRDNFVRGSNILLSSYASIFLIISTYHISGDRMLPHI